MATSGTQSPPLEATSRVDPMGAVNVAGDKAEGVKDSEQRKGVFISLVLSRTRRYRDSQSAYNFIEQFGGGDSGLKVSSGPKDQIAEVRFLISLVHSTGTGTYKVSSIGQGCS